MKEFQAQVSDQSDLDDDEEGLYYDIAFDSLKEDKLAVSDEDSDGSDGGATGEIQHWTRRVLRSKTELCSKHEDLPPIPDKSYATVFQIMVAL